MLFSPRAGVGDGCIAVGVALASSALGLLLLFNMEWLADWLRWQLGAGLSLAVAGRWVLGRSRLPH